MKRLLLGRPMSSGELEHTLLPKVLALPVFSSDPLSSNAYATQEALIVLALAGAAGLSLIVPISLAVATLLAIVVISYRQTVRAYPSGGGAYRVSRENLGMVPGLVAGSALLLDYILTVAVSITAGVEALVSAVPGLDPRRIQIAVLFIALVTLLNLRGSKESGVLFAVPTYGFVLAIYAMIITGFMKCLGGCPVAESADTILHPEHPLNWVLILRAFAAGTTALTGVEAIADGVPAFRYPQSRNAATTLAIMAGLSISMFLGISWLADHTGVVYDEHLEGQRSVVAQIAAATFSGGFMFYVVQFFSAAILILAANTAYQDFPRLSSILAGDRFLPKQFMNRGDRLVFSNGVIILALLAALLIWAFDADLTRLIQLYLIGVFISFTLSQSGMFVRSKRLKPPGWKRTAAMSAFGGTVTGIVLLVIAGTKFAGGAWIIILALPIVMYTMYSIHKHYSAVEQQLSLPERMPVDRRAGRHHMVLLLDRVDAAAARAVGYMRSARPISMTAITTDVSRHTTWKRLAPDVPVELLERRGSTTKRIVGYLRKRRGELPEDEFLTIVVPEILTTRTSTREILRKPRLYLLKALMLREQNIQLMNVPIVLDEIDPAADESHEPGRNTAIVLVSKVHNGTRQAIEYAETLRPTKIMALSIGIDPEESGTLVNDWLASGIQYPLEIADSPFRDISETLHSYIRRIDPDGVDKLVTIIIPEFIVAKYRHQLLHSQTALIVKRRMLFEKGVVVASVPYHL